MDICTLHPRKYFPPILSKENKRGAWFYLSMLIKIILPLSGNPFAPPNMKNRISKLFFSILEKN